MNFSPNAIVKLNPDVSVTNIHPITFTSFDKNQRFRVEKIHDSDFFDITPLDVEPQITLYREPMLLYSLDTDITQSFYQQKSHNLNLLQKRLDKIENFLASYFSY